MAHDTLNSLFTDIASAIREKKGDSAKIVADNFPTEIRNLPEGGNELPHCNITEKLLAGTLNEWLQENAHPYFMIDDESFQYGYVRANGTKVSGAVSASDNLIFMAFNEDYEGDEEYIGFSVEGGFLEFPVPATMSDGPYYYEVMADYASWVLDADSSDGTITPQTVLRGEVGYAQGERVVGEYEPPTPTYDTPSIQVSSGGLITASANGKSNTKQLTTKAGATITPNDSQQTAASSGVYTTGNVLVSAVPTETKSAVTPTKSSQTINASTGKYLKTLTVNPIPDSYIIPSGAETKTENGTYDVSALAQLIVNVSGGGGGLPTGISKVAMGTYTVSSDFTTTRQTVTHNMGVAPQLILFYADGQNIATTYSMLAALRFTQMGYRGSAYVQYMIYHGNSTSTVTTTNSNSTTAGISNVTSTTFQIASYSSSYYWRGGYTYKWIAIALT